MICKIKVQVIYRSLEDSSPRVNIVRLKLQYARKFVLFGLAIQQIYVKKPEFPLKIKTPTPQNQNAGVCPPPQREILTPDLIYRNNKKLDFKKRFYFVS